MEAFSSAENELEGLASDLLDWTMDDFSTTGSDRTTDALDDIRQTFSQGDLISRGDLA